MSTLSSSQFVPLKHSLSDDAPGYCSLDSNAAPSASSANNIPGPLCWKCAGTGINKKKSDEFCAVCRGARRLARKSVDIRGLRLEPELCMLVGGWFIFQYRGGHRWTTDDIVTAAFARRSTHYLQDLIREVGFTCSSLSTYRYLDLGCGNGSVLLMVSKHLPLDTICIGIEARSEAVSLARKSIEHNLGLDADTSPSTVARRISVIHGDFRTLYDNADAMDNDLSESLTQVSTDKFDLITGSPPYFRVEFTLSTSNTDTVADAIIRQGGMPTCKASAPARCEFRGGIEAYCAAAAAMLSSRGLFVVCENFLNHDRVLEAAKTADLAVLLMQRVRGKEGKSPLFCVYALVHKLLVQEMLACAGNACVPLEVDVAQPDIVVRDINGAWTHEYARLLKEMSYPVKSLHPNGIY